MIRYKKIRNTKFIEKDIQIWKNYNLDLDLDYLASRQRNYCKVYVSPFCDISMLQSDIPSPYGKFRKEIIKSLLEIYNSWEAKLKTLNKPYYLAIWLTEPKIEKSQVVCAIDDFLHFYEDTFFRPEEQRKLPIQNYGKFKSELEQFNWIFGHDEGHFTNDDLAMEVDDYANEEDYHYYQSWYKRKIKEGARVYDDGNGYVSYSFKQNDVWIGTKENR
ncbi:hypothetical protein ACFQ1Q_01605 [Winogradskyella litorisediminis]|uniref:Uncharacterized protein n=1 Tax=Winogradskyella litorisediminis TaxID=1156618 RepID=A0ABW3N640_9FLAO